MAGDTAHGAIAEHGESLATWLDINWDDGDPKEVRRRRGYGSWWRRFLPKYPEAQALLTILTATVNADHDRDPREAKALDAIVARSRTLRQLSMDRLDALHETVQCELGLDEWSSDPHPPKVMAQIEKKWLKAMHRATRSYCARDRDVAKTSLFLQALDIVRADQTILKSERNFYRDLAHMLGISKEDAHRCAHLIDRKNRH